MTILNKVLPFRKLWKLGYTQAAMKFDRETIKAACINKEATIAKERADLLKALFHKKNSRSGAVVKYDDNDKRAPKLGPLARKINSTKNLISQERIGEADERLRIFQNHLETDMVRTP